MSTPMKSEMTAGEIVNSTGVNLAVEERVWDLYTKGYTKTRIASIVGINRNTVAEHIKRASSRVLEEHMGTSAIEILTEELAKLAETESEISRDLSVMQATRGKVYFRNKDGELEELPAAIFDAQKSKLFKMKTDIIQQRIKMLQDCGAMPKSPEGMRKALKDYQIDEEGTLIPEDTERSDMEIEESISNLIKHGLRLTDNG